MSRSGSWGGIPNALPESTNYYKSVNYDACGRLVFRGSLSQGMETPTTFTAKAVCHAADIKHTTLNAWRTRPLRGDKDPNGPRILTIKSSGGWTRYNLSDAIRVCVLADLVRAGIELGAAAEIVNRLQSEDGLFRVDPAKVSTEQPSYRAVSKIKELRSDSGRAWSLSVADVDSLGDLRLTGDDSVAIVIDAAKIFRSAIRALRKVKGKG